MIPQNSFHFRIEFPRFDVTLCERGKKLLTFRLVAITGTRSGEFDRKSPTFAVFFNNYGFSGSWRTKLSCLSSVLAQLVCANFCLTVARWTLKNTNERVKNQSPFMALALESNPKKKKSTELTLQIVCSRSIIYILGRHTMFRPDSVSSTIYTDIYIKSKFSTFAYHLHQDFCSQSLWLSCSKTY